MAGARQPRASTATKRSNPGRAARAASNAPAEPAAPRRTPVGTTKGTTSGAAETVRERAPATKRNAASVPAAAPKSRTQRGAGSAQPPSATRLPAAARARPLAPRQSASAAPQESGPAPGQPEPATRQPGPATGPATVPDFGFGPSPFAEPGGPLQGLAAAATAAGASMPIWSIDPGRLLALQNEYATRLQKLWSDFVQGDGQAPQLPDKRFSSPAWTKQPPYAWSAALYLLNADFMQRMADSVESDRKTRDRIRFFTQQWVDALSPANFLTTNPEAQQKLLESHGDSLRHGIENLMSDVAKGHISMTDENAFEVGRNVGTSKGAVVFRNDIVELIQYAPTTPTVGARPLLLVPPFINKYYILDLQPENSFVAHAVERGHTVFLVSWLNAQPEHGKLTWEDYVERGVIEAIRRTQAIGRSETINALGFCVGGTILATTLAVLAARGERPVESLTLMTTLLDFEEPGVLGVFIDPAQVAWREQTIGSGGLMTGQELATTFSSLRPNDLVWNYVVANYLKGEDPPPFDLLYWNSDSTNLPGPLYCWYLRHMYLQNELREPGALTVLGQKVDLGAIDVPTFVFGAKEDHIVPWRAAYGSTQLLSNDVRFVMGASGHIAGAINPASKNRRSYWVGDGKYPPSPDDWLAAATERPGSWWNDWAAWLEPFKGGTRPAPKQLGDADNPVLEPAPGRYVKVKARTDAAPAGRTSNQP
jgi:polyhydroxyalkanoate synthase